MSIDVTSLILKHGYLMVFLGALTEGELIVITAGTIAYLGQLNFLYVILSATLGTAFSEYLSYLVGYKYGDGFLYQLTNIKYINKLVDSSKIDMVLHLIQIKHKMFILFFRFMPGVRTFGPILLGSSKVKPGTFFVYNLLAAFLWGSITASVGYATKYSQIHLGLANASNWIMIGIYLIINLTIVPTMLMKLFNIANERKSQK